MDHADFFSGRGEVASLMRAKDWAPSALGPAIGWPSSLRTVLRLMLTSRYAMWMGWGPDLTFFYNDDYAAKTLGAKHPWALGRSAREVWKEIWGTIGPRIDRVLETGEATWDEGLLLFLERSGYREETYHTFSYSPAPGDEAGVVAGLFCVVIEETERVIGDRRIALLRDLASRLGQTNAVTELFAAVEGCLLAEARDIPFSITYVFEDDGCSAHRVSQTGFDPHEPTVAEHVDLAEVGTWPLGEVLTTNTARVVSLPTDRVWPRGPWQTSPTRALVVPLAKQGDTAPAGVFIAGLNPHRPLDDSLRTFVELFVGQVAASLSNAGAYEEARKRAEALAELDRAKTAFFSNVSHEFRTPLTLMLGPTEDALGSSDRALRGVDLETVHRNELRLLKLVNVLLDFARIEAGRTRASFEATDLAALTTDLASAFRSAMERANVAFEVECPTLPEPVFVDRDMWEKIVLNLLSNALKFTFEGEVSVALAWRGDHAELTVRDTGVGIAASQLPRLFERFHRIEGGRARTHEGSGIGLAFVQELVRQHGGTIEVTSRLDEGTAFTISIPRGSSHLPHDRVGSPQEFRSTSAGSAYVEEALRWIPDHTADPLAQPPEPSSRTGARVLVADDNADMREYIARILRQHWNVETVSNGHDALASARRNRPDLILSDVMMPGLDGFALVRELRSDPTTATTPIVLLSARAGEEASAEGLRAGADDYVVKPFSASGLVVRVEAQLSAARLREALRRTAEEELERFAMMFRESPAAICFLRGPSHVIEVANPRILDVWGVTADVIGMPLFDAASYLRGQGLEELLDGVLRTGVAYRGTERLVRLSRVRDGVTEDHFFDFVYAPIRGTDGNLDGVFVDAYDVTDKVVARRNLEQLRESAEATNRIKDEFLATMGHELRTPLNAILGWSALLRRGTDDKKSIDRGLATIERNAKTQARLVEDILDVSRIISGKLRLDMRRVDLNAIARAAIDVVRPGADAKGVVLLLDLVEPDGVELVADADRLQQVVWNLLSNAIRFTPSGGTVSLHVERVDGKGRFVVRDTGAGIGSEHLPFVFERFRQVDSSTTRKYGGLGLGLAIVRHLVELHGGVVHAESAGLGAGTTFTVDLPIRAVHDARSDVAPNVETAISSLGLPPGRPVAGIEVLVVDDDDDSREVVERALSSAGATVHSVDSARAALALLARQRVDVLISDIGMPDEDGYSLIRRVRSLPADRGGKVPAIALTAYARGVDASRALDAGFQHHVSKPADVGELARIVASLVGA
jgi:signal transduction histidine kinase